jgi:hypothetical protein
VTNSVAVGRAERDRDTESGWRSIRVPRKLIRWFYRVGGEVVFDTSLPAMVGIRRRSGGVSWARISSFLLALDANGIVKASGMIPGVRYPGVIPIVRDDVEVCASVSIAGRKTMTSSVVSKKKNINEAVSGIGSWWLVLGPS